MPEYVLHIKVKGTDDGGSRVIGGLKSGLAGVMTVAGGILVADLFGKIAEGIGFLARSALTAAAEIQQLEIALETLVAKEIKQQEDYAMQATQVMGKLTNKQKEELLDLRHEYDILSAKLKENQQRIYEWTNVWTDEPTLKLNRTRAETAKMQYDLGKMGARIKELESIEGQWVTVTEKVRVGNMDLTEALKLAGPRAQELLVFLRDLSLVSPYQFNQVADTFRFSMALGATTDQAEDTTKATLNMAAALGLGNEQFKRLQYNLAQAIYAGDLTMVNLRQLKLVGLDLAGILESELGLSLEEVRNQMKSGKIDSEDLARAFSEHVDKYYAGAAERMTKTWTGLKNNFQDLLFFLGADLLRPALDAVTGSLSNLFDRAREALERGDLKKIGEMLGTIVEKILTGDVPGAIDTLAEGLRRLGLPEQFVDILDDLSLFAQAFKELAEGDVDQFIYNFAVGVGKLLENMGIVDAETAQGIASALINFGKGLSEFVGNAADVVAEWANTAWQDALSWWETNGPGITGAVETFFETFSEHFNWFEEHGPEVSENIDGITASIKSFWDRILEATEVGPTLEENSEGIKSTAIALAKLEEIEFDVVAKGIEILDDALVLALDWMEPMKALENLGLNIEDLSTKMGENYMPIENFSGLFTVLSAAIIDFLEAGPQGGLSNWLAEINEFIDGLKATWEEVQRWWGELIHGPAGRGGVRWAAAEEEDPTGLEKVWGELKSTFTNLFMGGESDVGKWWEKLIPPDLKPELVPVTTAFDEMSAGVKAASDLAGQAPIDAFENTWFLLTGQSIIPDMIADIVGLFDDLSTDLGQPLTKVYDAITNKMDDILTYLEDQIPDFERAGEDMALGIRKGVEEKWGQVIDTFKVKIRDLVMQILQELGIGSPSKVMADIGADMVEGLEQGILERWPGLESAVLPTVSSLANAIGTRLGAGLIQAAHAVALEDEKWLGSVLADIGGRLLSLGMSFTSRYTATYLDPLQEQIDSIEEAMAAAKREGQLEEYLALEARRNELTAEYAALQERVLRIQEAQQQLQFLQQQVQLIELIKEYGLDAQSILSGMTLGLEASTEDLVDAITRALEMIIATTQSTLQLGSPSRLFMDFGRDVMLGLSKGISSVRIEVPSPAMGGNGNVPQRVNQRNVKFEQTMNVYTQARSSEVLRDWGIMTHMAPTFSR